MLAYLDKQAQDNPFYLTQGEIEGVASSFAPLGQTSTRSKANPFLLIYACLFASF
jgi:hypothetical protein